MRTTFAKSPFGNIIVAATSKGICHLAFFEEERKAFEALEDHFPNTHFMQMVYLIQQNALYIFRYDWDKFSEIKLHLKGTDFQLQVCETLLKIPIGQLSTYGVIAEQIDNSKASRAVGTAIGRNLVAFLIPCHRVIQSTGSFAAICGGQQEKLPSSAGRQQKYIGLIKRNTKSASNFTTAKSNVPEIIFIYALS